jgi:hypothetical protein
MGMGYAQHAGCNTHPGLILSCYLVHVPPMHVALGCWKSIQPPPWQWSMTMSKVRDQESLRWGRLWAVLHHKLRSGKHAMYRSVSGTDMFSNLAQERHSSNLHTPWRGPGLKS